uniref:Uncharacterized protein n=1 Tax=Corethron hystrix TaxID=216773 RepID=A0A7S1BA86_9STRA|mmetsp:Transcript_18724/g.42757  ORF Transcript_18724/g.42757 Transcript_18724/m.42757 type:complete len:662 (+) Transcript_18724:180-2165(+)
MKPLPMPTRHSGEEDYPALVFRRRRRYVAHRFIPLLLASPFGYPILASSFTPTTMAGKTCAFRYLPSCHKQYTSHSTSYRTPVLRLSREISSSGSFDNESDGDDDEFSYASLSARLADLQTSLAADSRRLARNWSEGLWNVRGFRYPNIGPIAVQSVPPLRTKEERSHLVAVTSSFSLSEVEGDVSTAVGIILMGNEYMGRFERKKGGEIVKLETRAEWFVEDDDEDEDEDEGPPRKVRWGPAPAPAPLKKEKERQEMQALIDATTPYVLLGEIPIAETTTSAVKLLWEDTESGLSRPYGTLYAGNFRGVVRHDIRPFRKRSVATEEKNGDDDEKPASVVTAAMFSVEQTEEEEGEDYTLAILRGSSVDTTGESNGCYLIALTRGGRVRLWDAAAASDKVTSNEEAPAAPSVSSISTVSLPHEGDIQCATVWNGSNGDTIVPGYLIIGTTDGEVAAYALAELAAAGENNDLKPKVRWMAHLPKNDGPGIEGVVSLSCLGSGSGTLGGGGKISTTVLTGGFDGVLKQWELIFRPPSTLQFWPFLPNQRMKRRAHIFNAMPPPASSLNTPPPPITCLVGDASKIVAATPASNADGDDGRIVFYSPVTGDKIYTMDGFSGSGASTLYITEDMMVCDGIGNGLVCVHDFGSIKDQIDSYEFELLE